MAIDERSGPWIASLEAYGLKRYWQFDLWLDRILDRPHWKTRALILVLSVSLFRAFPSYDALRTPFVQSTWRPVQIKIDHPLADMSRLFPPDSHDGKLTFRLTVPILAHVLHLGQPGVMVLCVFAGLLLLWCVLNVTYRLTGSRKAALYTCLATACTWPGAGAFHQMLGGCCYDMIAICALFGALCSAPSVVTAACVFFAAWTDERALIACPLVFVFWMTEDGTAGRVVFSRKHVGIVLGAAAYFATRVYLTTAYSLTPIVSGGVGWGVLSQQVNAIPLGVWSGLGGQWLLVVCGLAAAWLQKQRMIAVALCVALVFVMGTALCVLDMTRSMAYCLPAVFVAMSLLRRETTRWLERVAFTSCLVSVIFPTYYIQGSTGAWWLYPLPMQAVRWLLPLADRL